MPSALEKVANNPFIRGICQDVETEISQHFNFVDERYQVFCPIEFLDLIEQVMLKKEITNENCEEWSLSFKNKKKLIQKLDDEIYGVSDMMDEDSPFFYLVSVIVRGWFENNHKVCYDDE